MKGQIDCPTGDRRHLSHLREGKISFEVFCQKPDRREEMGMLPIPEPDELFVDAKGVTLPIRRPKKR